ncbi:GlxA family transcriptional regulator [Marinobacterium sp. AK62]|uniref:GlxA family transcriptional regulator n=1 Tax=Marinobacterium alkalitolerans TaxID=1542925 RepID=A0ABS3ZA97_9GAMM|nr:GlxA family transcriptional regulator [Marinobacterium alkalitolerans]MBP0048270.1 GlxA family transcriptional regulator [Marinobacterium alkalitolerans]
MTTEANSQTENVGFFLIPEFSMISFAAVVDPLRMANRLSGKPLYRWHFYGPGDQPVVCSNGIAVPPSRPMQETDDLQRLFVVAGINAHLVDQQPLFKWLRRLSRQGVALGGTSTGSLLLARAGLLKGHTCTIHWENRESMQEEFPRLNVTGELYEIDGRISTCSGGLAGLDMILQIIALKHGETLANDVAEQCIHPHIRPAHDKQRMKFQLRYHANHPRLVQALELMRENLEEVLSCEEIAQLVGISTRQLERLFHQHLQLSPAQYYMELRLERARHLLQQSSLTILQIATACGFSSTSYFSRCFRRKYDCSPREARSHT